MTAVNLREAALSLWLSGRRGQLVDIERAPSDVKAAVWSLSGVSALAVHALAEAEAHANGNASVAALLLALAEWCDRYRLPIAVLGVGAWPTLAADVFEARPDPLALAAYRDRLAAYTFPGTPVSALH